MSKYELDIDLLLIINLTVSHTVINIAFKKSLKNYVVLRQA